MSDHIKPNNNENHKFFREEFFYKKTSPMPSERKDGFDVMKVQATIGPKPGSGIERFYFSHN